MLGEPAFAAVARFAATMACVRAMIRSRWRKAMTASASLSLPGLRRDVVAHRPAGATNSAGPAIQPMRRPGRPNGFEKVPTLIARSPRSRIGGASGVAAGQVEPAVRLVAEDTRTERLGQLVDALQIGCGEHRAGRVVRRVDDDQLRVRGERASPARRGRSGSRSPAAASRGSTSQPIARGTL